MPDSNKNNIDNEDLQNDVNKVNSEGSQDQNTSEDRENKSKVEPQDQLQKEQPIPENEIEPVESDDIIEEKILNDEDDPSEASIISEENKTREEPALPEINITKKKPAESNYQVSLVNENLLKIKISTDREVDIVYNVSGGESGKIVIDQSESKKKNDIELIVSIHSEKKPVVIPDNTNETHAQTESSGSGNNIIPPITQSREFTWEPEKPAPEVPKTEDEILYEKLEKKNPYVLFRRIYRRNLTQAAAGAIIIYLILVALFGAYASNKKTPQVEPEQRLVIIQDMPEPKINLENVEDPNAPPPEEETDEEGLIPRKITRTSPPRIYRPRTENNTPNEVDTTDLANKERELDSLRNLATKDSLDNSDSIDTGTSSIPDSLKTSFSANEVGLVLNYPKNWKVIDNREIDKNKKEFDGIILTDTTAKEGDFTIFLYLDKDGRMYNQADYNEPFSMDDTTISAFRNDPRTVIAGRLEYKFYLFGKTDKLSIVAKPTKGLFDKYKPMIEAVVRSIRIKRPGA